MKPIKKFILVFCISLSLFLIYILNLPSHSDKIKIEEVIFSRISFCSLDEFDSITATGVPAGVFQVAVSQEHRRWLGHFLYLQGKLYFITDVTHERFKNTLDIYVPYPIKICRGMGIRENMTGFFIDCDTLFNMIEEKINELD